MMAKESWLGAVDKIRLASVQNVVVSARSSSATRGEINRLLEDSASYAAAARMDSVHIGDFASRKIDLVAQVGHVMSDKGERVVSLSTECMDETTDDAGAGVEKTVVRSPSEAETPDGAGAGDRAKKTARREPPEAETPDGGGVAGGRVKEAARRQPPGTEAPDNGGGAAGRVKRAARRQPPEAEDKDSDRPSMRARHSDDQPSRKPGSSDSSVPDTESENDDSSGGARSSSGRKEEDKD